jgi:hypothetical protein
MHPNAWGTFLSYFSVGWRAFGFPAEFELEAETPWDFWYFRRTTRVVAEGPEGDKTSDESDASTKSKTATSLSLSSKSSTVVNTVKISNAEVAAAEVAIVAAKCAEDPSKLTENEKAQCTGISDDDFQDMRGGKPMFSETNPSNPNRVRSSKGDEDSKDNKDQSDNSSSSSTSSSAPLSPLAKSWFTQTNPNDTGHFVDLSLCIIGVSDKLSMAIRRYFFHLPQYRYRIFLPRSEYQKYSEWIRIMHEHFPHTRLEVELTDQWGLGRRYSEEDSVRG